MAESGQAKIDSESAVELAEVELQQAAIDLEKSVAAIECMAVGLIDHFEAAELLDIRILGAQTRRAAQTLPGMRNPFGRTVAALGGHMVQDMELANYRLHFRCYCFDCDDDAEADDQLDHHLRLLRVDIRFQMFRLLCQDHRFEQLVWQI